MNAKEIEIVDTLNFQEADKVRADLLKLLNELPRDKNSDEVVKVIFKHGAGYSASFLDAVFGGVARALIEQDAKTAKTYIEKHLALSSEDPGIQTYVNLAHRYMDEAMAHQ